ncbi:hypothetical protein ACEPPN_019166 [Leptodophora sp. 'Broadleaf-Isolate-01']
MANIATPQVLFPSPNFAAPQSQVTGDPLPGSGPALGSQYTVFSPFVTTDKTCHDIYNELKTKAPNPFIRWPTMTDEQQMTISDLFSVIVTRDLVHEAETVLTSPGMQSMFEPNTSVDPHNLIIVDNNGNIFTFLRWASLFGSVAMLQVLFHAKTIGQRVFDVNFVDIHNYTPLESVCSIGVALSRNEKADCLFHVPGFEVSKTRPFALQNAIQTSAFSMNLQDKSGRDESLVGILLEKGADVDLVGGFFGTCLEAASFFSSSEMMYRLIALSKSKTRTLNTGGARYWSLLQAVSCLGRLDVVKHLLDLVETMVSEEGGVYGCAVTAAAKGLTQHLADTYITDAITKNFWGCHRNLQDGPQRYLDIVELLLAKGADVTCMSRIFIINPLSAAVSSNHPPILRALLDKSQTSIDQTSIDITTKIQDIYAEALTTAAMTMPPVSVGASAMLDLLMATGIADPNRCSSRMDGWYPLQVAALFGHVPHVSYLVARKAEVHLNKGVFGGPIRATILTSIMHWQESETICKLLLDNVIVRSPAFSAGDRQYSNILHLAISNGLLNVVSYLLMKGVDCQVRDLGQRTVLHIATMRGSIEMIRTLLESRNMSDEIIEAEDSWGRTAFQIAEEESRKAQDLVSKAQGVNLYPNSASSPSPTLGNLVQLSRQWAAILNMMQPLELRALADGETRHHAGSRVLGPKIKAQAKSDMAKPVVVPLPRGSGLGFQATIVDFEVDVEHDLETHRMKKPSIDEVLYTSNPHQIMSMQEVAANAFDPQPLVAALPGQPVAQPYPGTSSTYRDPELRWIHLPANNMAWVEDLVNNIRMTQQEPMPAVSKELWGVDLQSTSPDSAPHMNSIAPQCKLISLGNQQVPIRVKCYLSFYVKLPYIHWETTQGQDDTMRILEGKSSKEADPSDTLLQTYIGKNPPLHIRRTLDQYYYSRLKDTKLRDHDQVANRARDEDLKFRYLTDSVIEFSRWCSGVREQEQIILNSQSRSAVTQDAKDEFVELTEAIKELDRLERLMYNSSSTVKKEDIPRVLVNERVEDSPIIMVDQLWVWVLDDNTVISSFPPRRQGMQKMGLDPNNKTDILRSISKYLRMSDRSPVRHPRDLVNLIVAQSLAVLLDNKNRIQELDFITTFSTQAASVLDKTAKLLQLFVKSFEQYGTRSEVPGDVFEIVFSVTKETLLFREVQDIRDELGMLSALFQDQLDVLAGAEKIFYHQELLKNKENEDKPSFQIDTTQLGLARARVAKHQRDVKRMEGQAVQAYEMLKDLLDLKQQQANVLEARQSRKQAVIAAKQGKVVLVFTVVTIIFMRV